MATPPLPVAITNQIKARNQSVRWAAILREVREFRAYVCNIDSDVIMGVSVPPVAIVSLTPNPICLGSAMAWDLSGSYAPGSSISTYAIDFGDSNDDTGQSGSHTYAVAGTYTVTSTIISAAGVTTIAENEVNVIDCSSTLLLNSIYASTDGSGVFYWE
jgi:hypothetical protein